MNPHFKRAERFLGAVLLFVSFLALPETLWAAVTNRVNNSSFESTLGAGNWDQTADRGITNPALADAPDGDHVLRLSEAEIANPEDFTFTFQLTSPVKEGDFVTFAATAREVVVDGDDDGQIVIEFKNAADGTISSVITSVPSANFSRIVASGVAPASTVAVAFVMRIQNASDGDAIVSSIVDFDSVSATINGSPLYLDASAPSTHVRAGSMKMVALRLHNLSSDTLTNVEVVAQPDEGIHIRAGDGNVDGHKVGSREGSVIFAAGTLLPAQESVFSFPVVFTSGIVIGKSYSIRAFARATTVSASEPIEITFHPEGDPVFDEATIIGKVFNDTNQNGVQDEGEKGVPWVRLATEWGVVVVTDEHGKYHIPAVRPGRHVVKIDGHTLPEGTKFITEEAYLVKNTSGMMAKANFAVLIPPSQMSEQFERELMVSVTQGLDTSRPNLEVAMQPEILKLGVDILQTQPVFRIHMNYTDFVKNWYLEIRDEMGREMWTGFGLGAPPSEMSWSGEMDTGDIIRPGVYSYQLKVEDHKGYQDWTPLYFFRVLPKGAVTDENRSAGIPAVGDFNILKDGKRTISLVAKPTIQIQGKTLPENKIQINAYEIPVDPETGYFQTQIYATPGDKDITVTASSPEGENTTVSKKITVKDSTFFMVALGEEQLGMNFQDGNVETAGGSDQFKDGFYEDGRLSYYLRGKLKGKFLVKSRYDSGDNRSALFTNLDPDEYYPVYGDGSTRDYEGQDTLDHFYIVVEMDRSFVKWGSFKTEFNDTEMATYNRTLSGLKIHHETMSTTPYGDPKRGFKLFWTESAHRADHNEFAATGGSLYYLRNRGVIQGSEKIRIEVRDKIHDIVVESFELAEGLDYEIDYAEGRILLSKPLSSISASDTLVSYDILGGNPVYMIVDYEYDAGANTFETPNRGLRGYTHLGNHIKVGGTAVEEKRIGGDYDLRAVDATFKMGRNTKVVAEYAESKMKQTEQGVSYNGGLSFANLDLLSGPATRERENAFLIKAESKPIKNLETTGYLQGVDPGFSTERSRSQEGYRKYGVAAKYNLTENWYARYRFDASDIENDLLPLSSTSLFAPYERLRTSTLQTVYDGNKWLAEAEYRRQTSDIPIAEVSPTLLSEIPFETGIAGKLGYHINERLLPYVKVQAGFDNKPNNQFGGGVRYRVVNDLFGYIEQMFGNIGDSTNFGFEKYNGMTRSYANLRMLDSGIGQKSYATAIGSSHPLSERSRIFSERERSVYNGQDGYADIYGYDNQLNENWSFQAKYERRHLDNSSTRLLDNQAQNSLMRTNTFNTVSGGVGYRQSNKFKARTFLEYRRDQDAPKMSQWVTRNNLEYQINRDLSFLGKLDFGKSRFLDPDDTTADFTEFSTGFAYRPVMNDKLNVLTRYTYLNNIANDLQFVSPLYNGVETDEMAHIIAIDLAYDLHRYLGIVEKVAYKNSILNTSVTEEIILHHLLLAHRFNFHVTRKWDVALEYRMLWQFDAAQTLRHGALAEVDREIYDYVRFGMGYNFTDFDDDLRKPSNYDAHGPFVRLSGKF